MNNYGDEYNSCCYFHPKEVMIGVCHLCLTERLLNLASKKDDKKNSNSRSFRILRRPSISLLKLFVWGSFLQKSGDSSDQGSIANLEDSFISIKFDDKGEELWQRQEQKVVSSGKAEHVKPRGMPRWHKRIDQMLQVARCERGSKAGVTHMALVS